MRPAEATILHSFEVNLPLSFPMQEDKHLRQHDGHDGEVPDAPGGPGGREDRAAGGREEEV